MGGGRWLSERLQGSAWFVAVTEVDYLCVASGGVAWSLCTARVAMSFVGEGRRLAALLYLRVAM